MTDRKFSFSTIDNFDEHINKSIRGYSELIDDIKSIGRFFVSDGSTVIDIGCSTGKMLVEMSDSYDTINDVTYIGIDNEPNMISNQIEHCDVVYVDSDVRDYDGWVDNSTSLILSIFTLQFINKTDRQSIVNNIYNTLSDGSAFVFSEKIYSDNAICQEIMTFAYYDHKRNNFTDEAILDKEQSLRSILRPSTNEEIMDMLRIAGFNKVEQFWRNHNFVGYIAIK